MKAIPRDVAVAAQKILNTDEGTALMSYMIREFGLMDRAFITDHQGKVSPINAAIRDGERGVVGLLFKLKQGETYDPPEDEG